MEILHLKDSGDTSVVSEYSLGVNLVIDNSCYVVSDTSPPYKICVNLVIDNFDYVASPLYTIWKYLIGLLLMEILHFEDLGDTSVNCERSCSIHRSLIPCLK